MGDDRAEQHDEYNAFLRSLLGDAVGTPQPPSHIASTSNVHTQCTYSQQMLQGAVVQISAPTGPNLETPAAAAFAEGAKTFSGRRRSVIKNSSTASRHAGLKELERQLGQKQQELRQQLSRRLYLTKRVEVLEQLVQLHHRSEELSRHVKAGLSYNPLAAWDTTVEEFKRLASQPGWVISKFQHQTQCLAARLASCTSLFQKYPQLVTYTPPADVLSQLVAELSLAEPTNPYGADGLPVGSLTVPVPKSVISKFAAAYSLNMTHMSHAEQAMVECCATLVIEVQCCQKLYEHAFHLNPSLFNSDGVRLTAAAYHSSWEELVTSLSLLQVHDSSDSTVADKTHWQQVARCAGLTDNQKLQAAVLWDILLTAQQASHSQRSQIVSQMKVVPQQRQADLPAEAMTSLHSDREQRATAVYEQSAEQLTQQEVLMQRLTDTLAKERCR